MTHSDLNNQAERAADITDAEIATIMKWRGPGAHTEVALRNVRKVLDADRARRVAAPALDAEGLPPLSAFTNVYVWVNNERVRASGYTTDQMRAYAHQAVEADRRSRVSADQWASLDAARLQLEAAKIERENMKARLARQSAPEGAPVGMGGWISVDERLPPPCQTVIVHSTRPRSPAVDASYISNHPLEVVKDEQITHWMPLPSAPQPPRQDQQPAQHDHSEGGHE